MAKFFSRTCFLLVGASAAMNAWSAIPRTPTSTAQLDQVRREMAQVETKLSYTLKDQKALKARIVQIRTWLALERKARLLHGTRMEELTRLVDSLEERKKTVRSKLSEHETGIRGALITWHHTRLRGVGNAPWAASEPELAPRRYLLTQMIRLGLNEVESYRADLADAEQIETQIQDERRELAHLLLEAQEREEMMKFHEGMQSELLVQQVEDRRQQLDRYRKLKDSEASLESLLTQFNARQEYERTLESEREAARSMAFGEFARRQGTLPPPVLGRVVRSFGKAVDPESRLSFFRKSAEFEAKPEQDVRAVFAGRVAFVGELPLYGRVVILDHGNHFYSVVSKIGGASKKVGDFVTEGEAVAKADRAGTPIALEIRQRHVALDPKDWLSAKL